jgi:leucyl aminopeptidase
MEIKVAKVDITKSTANAIILNYFENTGGLPDDILPIDRALDGAILKLITQGEIKGKFKELTTIYSLGKLPATKVVILGLGKKGELTSDKIRTGTAEICKHLRQKGSDQVDLLFNITGISGINAFILGQSITEGALLGTYTFKKHVTKTEDNMEIKQLNIITSDEAEAAELERGCQQGKITAESTILVRDMVNEPSNYMTPYDMSQIALRIAEKYSLDIKILEREDMHEQRMGGLLGVSQGSQQPPKFIIMKYQGQLSNAIDIALVGKGITFDSGGISIKPSSGMGDMKGDMAGGASVIGVMNALAQLKPKINVAGLIPATENLPSGTALKPGDIITIMNGKTVEIISTDAEGRLILADAISYAKKLGAKRIVDIATLTGSCQIALGDVCTGAFGNDQVLVNQIIAAGNQAGECIWQMPMNEEYREQNKSEIADVKNTGGRYAGAITAAWFLGEFTDGTPWVHLDIAGTSMLEKDRGYQIKGSTGVPTRTLINLALSLND